MDKDTEINMGIVSPELIINDASDFRHAANTLIGVLQVREEIADHLPRTERPFRSGKHLQWEADYDARSLIGTLHRATSYEDFKVALETVFRSKDTVKHVLQVARDEDFDAGFDKVYHEDLVREVEDPRIKAEVDASREAARGLLGDLCRDFGVPETVGETGTASVLEISK